MTIKGNKGMKGVRETESKETKHTKVGTVKISKQSGFPMKKVAAVKDAGVMFKTKKK